MVKICPLIVVFTSIYIYLHLFTSILVRINVDFLAFCFWVYKGHATIFNCIKLFVKFSFSSIFSSRYVVPIMPKLGRIGKYSHRRYKTSTTIKQDEQKYHTQDSLECD